MFPVRSHRAHIGHHYGIGIFQNLAFQSVASAAVQPGIVQRFGLNGEWIADVGQPL